MTVASIREIGLTSAFEPVRTVTTRLIQDHRYVRPRSDKLTITAFYHVTIGLCLVALVLSLFRGKAGHG